MITLPTHDVEQRSWGREIFTKLRAAVDFRTAFIVGSPRSGTTILGRILEAHPEIAYWYEPYYIWYYHAKDLSTDVLLAEDFGPRELHWIRNQFEVFARRTRKGLIVDKSPEHSLNLRIVNAAFPAAKYIHMVRDGRDVVLSIKKEWNKRRELVRRQSFRRLLKTAVVMLRRQPLWRFRLQASWYELSRSFPFTPKKLLNKAKWKGQVGWGPRFEGWQEVLRCEPLICFHAYQWLRCVEQIERDLPLIPQDNVLQIRYEDLTSEKHEAIIRKVIDFLGIPCPPEFIRNLPAIQFDNSNKWPRELSGEEINAIGPILDEKLRQLGYDDRVTWYR